MSVIYNIQEASEKLSLSQAERTLIMHNNETFKYWDEGCTRYVYVNADRTKVVKIEKMKHSTKWNEDEINRYKEASDEDRELMAPTRLIGNIIEQDFVLPIKYGGKRLNIEQADFAASCRSEVGWTRDGRLVCFDLDEFKKY